MQLQTPVTPVVAADIDIGIDFEIDPDLDIDFDSYRYTCLLYTSDAADD